MRQARRLDADGGPQCSGAIGALQEHLHVAPRRAVAQAYGTCIGMRGARSGGKG
jgi:hypothetical protein